MRVRHDLADGYKPLFVDWFANKNDFVTSPHEGGIAGVAQDADDQDNDNGDDYANMDQFSYKAPVISLETAAACGEI